MLTEFNSRHPPEVAYKEIVKQIEYEKFTVASSIEPEQIVLTGERVYSVGVLVVLVAIGLLLFVVGAIIAVLYYLTRPYQKIIIELEPMDTGSHITITYKGKKQVTMIQTIKEHLGPNTV